MDRQPEFDLLLSAVHFMQFQSLPTEHKVLPESGFDHEKLVRLATSHGLIFPVYCFCRAFYPEQSTLIDHLHRRSIKNVMRVSRSNQQLMGLSEKLLEKNIPHAFLKGQSACKQFYQKVPDNWRPSVDIDILIDPKSLPEAVRLLISESYICKQVGPEPIAAFVSAYSGLIAERDLGFSLKDHCDIDLHWRVAHRFSLPMDTEYLLANTESVEINNTQIPVLAFNWHFILLCIHGYLDRFYTLKHLADIFFACHHSRFNRQEVDNLALGYGVFKQVDESIQMARFFFSDLASPKTMYEQSRFTTDSYSRFMINNGVPPRMHPNRSEWSRRDKRDYMRHQIKTRSRKVSFFSPVIHRLKCPLSMIVNDTGQNLKHPLRLLVNSWYKRMLRTLIIK